ncbi:hypothetical protein THARTR1_03946 [Trichoderma harzianum]|uniref:Uncharacterized protein n=1 Tax=Trichoderma harzianum TaxID=5544 RepID=A0A2K0UE07_TRIHA|nr:hypothetical protein THARTR1_03946 [Trichoderma harzianum]
MAELNSVNRPDPTPVHSQTGTVTPTTLTAKECCDCTHGKLEKKIKEMFEDLEKKMDEKLEPFRVYAEASTKLLEIATGKRPAAPQDADV